MSISRDSVDVALKSIVVPTLRDLGFHGSYPHFYRDHSGHIDLLTFQFSMSGGKFIVELSYADAERANVYFRKDTPVQKLRTSQTTERHRLGTTTHDTSDHWFSFETTGFLHWRRPAKLAREVQALLLAEAEPWWRGRCPLAGG